MPNKIEHLFLCWLAITFSVKCQLKSIASFSMKLTALSLSVLCVCLHNLDVNSLLNRALYAFPLLLIHLWTLMLSPTILLIDHPFPAVGFLCFENAIAGTLPLQGSHFRLECSFWENHINLFPISFKSLLHCNLSEVLLDLLFGLAIPLTHPICYPIHLKNKTVLCTNKVFKYTLS